MLAHVRASKTPDNPAGTGAPDVVTGQRPGIQSLVGADLSLSAAADTLTACQAAVFGVPA